MTYIKIGDILKMFYDGPKNDFERMALFTDDLMKETARKMQEALAQFAETGEYSDYLVVKSNFENITKYMNSRDGFMTHNPDRSSRY